MFYFLRKRTYFKVGIQEHIKQVTEKCKQIVYYRNIVLRDNQDFLGDYDPHI
jgi:hypothetical protein